MKATTIRTNARGLQLNVSTDMSPVVVLTGPNGSGKTTVLQSLAFALAGGIPVGTRVVSRLQDVYGQLGTGDSNVRSQIVFDDGTSVDRMLAARPNGNGLKLSTRLSSSLESGSVRDVQAAIADHVGNPVKLDVGALLALAPKKRRERIIELCADSVWTEDTLRQRLVDQAATTEVEGAGEAAVAYLDTVEDLLLDATKDAADEAREAVTNCERRLRELQAAINRLSADSAAHAQKGHGTIDEVDAEIARLNGEVGSLEREMGEAQTIAQRREQITREIETLRQLNVEPVEVFEGRVREATQRLAAAGSNLAELRDNPIQAYEEHPDLLDLRSRLSAMQVARDQAAAGHAHANRLADAARGIARNITAGSTCPTCRQAVGSDHANMLNGHAEELMVEAQQFAISLAKRNKALSSVSQDLDELQRIEQRRKDRLGEKHANRAAQMRLFEQQLAPGGFLERDVAQSEHDLAERKRSGDRITMLRASAAELVPVDISTLRASLDGAKQQRAEATERRKIIADAAQRHAQRNRLVAERDEEQGKQDLLKAVASTQAAVLAEMAEAATGPFVNTVNALAPEGWTLSIDAADAAFNVSRADRPQAVPLTAMSNGEQALYFGAFGAALAQVSGSPWRCVIADSADAMSADCVPGAEHGVLVQFIRGLHRAVEHGVIHQAFVATARLEHREREALEQMGVRVVAVCDERAWSKPMRQSYEYVEHEDLGDLGAHA